MTTGSLDAATQKPEQYWAFGRAIDDIRKRAEAKVGADDLGWIRRVRLFSRTMEVIGRGLIHVSFEPLGFTLGVLALFLSKQVEATEIGHSVLHGAYDGIEGANEFRSRSFFWHVPIDEESWRYGHNVRHHGATNIGGKDPDIHFGPARLTVQTPHRPIHRAQFPFMLFILAPNFAFFMNWHFTGLHDYYFGNGRPEEFDIIPDRSWKTALRIHWKALRKYAKLYAIDYVLFPALAGPMFWKVMLGNWLASTLRDLYSAATIYCGHVGEDVASYADGTRADGRGAFYAMQIAATNNFEVSQPLSILCGALDKQIEHHLFPRLPPNRLREVAPEVRAACAAHGIEYRSKSWGATLEGALRHIRALSQKEGAGAALRAMA